MAQLGCVSPHPWLSRTDRLHHPDQLVIDLDPPDDDFGPVRDAGRRCRELLEELGLLTFAKTTGSRGIHIVVPLDRSCDFEIVRTFARGAMELLARRFPESLTTEIRKKKRRGRLLLDVARNAYAQTAVAPYAVRARPGAPVATPIHWNEIGCIEAQSFTIRNLFGRLKGRDDPWKGMRRHAHGLERARQRLERLWEKEATNA
jgi:bifunctional non-homologous end joining protein LigD